MDISDQIAKKTRPFFLNFFQRLADDLNTLVDTPVECTLVDVTLLRGDEDLAPLFEANNSVAHIREDGLNVGMLHLVMEASAVIALSGFMMMLPKAVVAKNVKVREYTEEIKEGFHEVANQIAGSLNTLVEEKMAGGHLFLDKVEHLRVGSKPAILNPLFTYLDVSMEITIADFRPVQVHWLLSRKFGDSLLGFAIPPSQEESDLEEQERAALEAKNAPPVVEKVPPKVEVKVNEYEFDDQADDLLARAAGADLPGPNEPGGLKVVMTLPPFALNDTEAVTQAVFALIQSGYRYIGVERQGALFRVLSRSDVRRIIGAFYGSKAVTPREKALLSLPVGKLNEQQKLVSITTDGTIGQAFELLNAHHIHALPVVTAQGKLRGFVSIHALLDYFRKKAG